MRLLLAGLAGIALGMGAVAASSDEPVEGPRRTRLPPDPHGPVREIVVDPAADAGRPGRVFGVVGQRYFTSTDGGESPDLLRFEFTAPARLHRVHVSVDVGAGSKLVEFVVGVNGDGYAIEDRSASWLLHTSYNGDDGGSTDEAVDLPDGVEVAAGDAVTVGAWLNGDLPVRVSPEVVVLYEWI